MRCPFRTHLKQQVAELLQAPRSVGPTLPVRDPECCGYVRVGRRRLLENRAGSAVSGSARQAAPAQPAPCAPLRASADLGTAAAGRSGVSCASSSSVLTCIGSFCLLPHQAYRLALCRRHQPRADPIGAVDRRQRLVQHGKNYAGIPRLPSLIQSGTNRNGVDQALIAQHQCLPGILISAPAGGDQFAVTAIHRRSRSTFSRSGRSAASTQRAEIVRYSTPNAGHYEMLELA